MKLVIKDEQTTQDQQRMYAVFTATDAAHMHGLNDFADRVERMNDTEPVVLELAATYDAFHETVNDHDRAMRLLRRMKSDKCTEDNIRLAMALLADLDLPCQ